MYFSERIFQKNFPEFYTENKINFTLRFTPFNVVSDLILNTLFTSRMIQLTFNEELEITKIIKVVLDYRKTLDSLSQ